MDLEKHYYDRIAEFQQEKVEPGGIVFLGSSHLEWFDTDRLLPGHHIVNRGIVGDYIGVGERGIFRRLDVSVFDCRPGQVVLHNGVNDLGELARTGVPPMCDIASRYQQVVRAIRSNLPLVPLLLVRVLPTGESRADVSRLVPQLNEHIQAVGDENECEVLDMWSDFADERGLLHAELTYDDLHLTESGYQIYARKIKPHLLRSA